ncbi:MAG TPA: hypothetical protein VG096_22405 [Bryobacteraceae bacterium]|jgi:hypothetical protein|nr:hypothetical protein [Bryobacteraceae bacterium]
MKRLTHHSKARRKQNAGQLRPSAITIHTENKQAARTNQNSFTHLSKQAGAPVALALLQYRWHLILLLLLPWLILLINPNWPFQGFGHMDTWMYFGSFIHFPHYQRLLPNYAGERLPWIIPGYLLTRILPAAFASAALHIICFYVSVFSVYYIVRRYAGLRTALLTAAFLGCHGMFVGANGWEYVDGGSMAYESLTLAMLAAADRSRHPRFFLILAGVALGGLIYTYPQWAGFTPAFFIFYLVKTDFSPAVSSWRRIGNQLWSFVIPFFVGFALVTGLLALIHSLSGGHGFFYETSVRSMFGLWQANANPNNTHGYRWVLFASWLVFPILTFLVGTGAWIQHWRGILTLSKPARAIIGSYLYCFVFLVLLQLRSHSLEWDYVASILIPGIFLVLGVTVFNLPARANIGSFFYATAVVIGCAICLFPLSRPGSYRWLLFHNVPLLAALAAAASAARLALPRRVWTWPVVVGSVSCCSFALVPAYPGIAWRAQYHGLAAQERIASAIEIIQKRLPPDRYPAFWINNVDDPLTAEYRAVMCSFLAHNLSMYRFPILEPRVYPPGSFIILINRDANSFNVANEKMSKAGMPLSLVSRDRVTEDGTSYQIVCVKVLPRPQTLS